MTAAPAAGVFRPEGDYWTLSYEGTVVRAKDTKGLRYLSRLLASPGRELHVLDLLQPGQGPSPASARDEVIDRPARIAFQARVRELEEDIEDASSRGDTKAAERATAERDAVLEALASAYGLGGRARKASGDPAERARKAVTERIRTTITRLEKIHPPLGGHLRRSIRTGTFCAYDPDIAVEWMNQTKGSTVRRERSSVRVVIVDDHPLWRGTLRKVLEHEGVATVVAEAADGEEALDIALRARPDVVLMDIDLPGMNGTDATRALVDAWPEAKVLVLSASDERRQVVDAVAAGADGYLLKTAAATDIADAVRRVHDGELVLPAPLSRMVLSELRRDGR